MYVLGFFITCIHRKIDCSIHEIQSTKTCLTLNSLTPVSHVDVFCVHNMSSRPPLLSVLTILCLLRSRTVATRALPLIRTAASCPSLLSTLSTSSSFEPSEVFRVPSVSKPECAYLTFLQKNKGLKIKRKISFFYDDSYTHKCFPKTKGRSNVKVSCFKNVGGDRWNMRRFFLFPHKCFVFSTKKLPLTEKEETIMYI